MALRGWQMELCGRQTRRGVPGVLTPHLVNYSTSYPHFTGPAALDIGHWIGRKGEMPTEEQSWDLVIRLHPCPLFSPALRTLAPGSWLPGKNESYHQCPLRCQRALDPSPRGTIPKYLLQVPFLPLDIRSLWSLYLTWVYFP